MNSILILGAGTMQIPAIKAAKEEGFFVVCVDANPLAPGVPLVDEFQQIDLKDAKKIFEFAKTIKNLQGVFTAGTDFSTSVSYVAEKLNLHSHSFESSLNASDKSRMRSSFFASGVPSPFFLRVDEDTDKNELVSFANKIGYPCVSKPVDNMGSRSCKIIQNENEIERAVTDAILNSKTKTAIVEEFIDGDEYSIDALVYDGSMTITGFADRHIFFPPYFVEMGHTMSSSVSEQKKLELIAVFAFAVKSLGLTCGAAKADIKYSSKGPVIGEVAARLSGGYMSGWTFPYASGFNLTKEALRISAGTKPSELERKRVPLKFLPPQSFKKVDEPFKLFCVPCKNYSAERACISLPGVVNEIVRFEKVDSVKDVFLRYDVGDEVSFPKNNVEKCGNVISVSARREDAISSAEDAISEIVFRLKPNCNKTDLFLQEDIFTSYPPSFYPYSLNAEDCVTIPRGKSIFEYVPKSLEKLLASSYKDWNHRTFQKTCELFDKLAKGHCELDGKKFWKAALRGGIQGMLYVNDSLSK